jgi:CDGSH-type Zn-finger protein
MSANVSVTVIPNGPLKISGDALSLRYCGEPLGVEAGKDVYLCRCGQSSNAPFCDGSHSKSGFVAEPGRGDAREIKVWQGRTIQTFFNPNVCMHVGYCKPLGELRERELGGDDGAASEIAAVVQSCPSGALTWESSAVSVEAPESPADVEIMEGGEVRVHCAFDLNVGRLARQPEDRATLCRCGLSKNKPFCDGRHTARKDFR